MDTEKTKAIQAGKLSPKDLPAGATREEAQLIAADALAQRAEAEGEGMGAIDPEALEEDREILQHFNIQSNLFDVTDAQPGFRYLLCRDNPMTIIEAKARARAYLGGKHTGFEIVQGDMPEAIEWRDARGYRVLGDCILMRIPDAEAQLIEKAQERINAQRTNPDAIQLMALAEKFRRQVGDKVAAHVITGQTPRDYFQNRGQHRGRIVTTTR